MVESRGGVVIDDEGVDAHIDPMTDEILLWLHFRKTGKKIVSSIFYSVTSSIQTNQKCKEVRDRSAEDEKVKNEVIISFESAD